MALPTLAKTWNISANNSVTAAGTYLLSQQTLWLNFINYLVANGWTIRAASNSNTASTTTTMSTAGDFNWNAVSNGSLANRQQQARSWVILRNTALGSTFDISFDFSCISGNYSYGKNTAAYVGSFVFSIAPGGYDVSGALSSTTNLSVRAPTEVVIAGGFGEQSGPFFGNVSVNPSYVWHGWTSSDNECTRCAWFYNDVLVAYFSIEKVMNPVTGWVTPVVASFRTGTGSSIGNLGYYSNAGTALSTGSLGLNAATTYGYAAARIDTALSGTNVGVFYSGEGYTSGMLSSALAIPNDVSGEYPFIPLGVVSTTPPVRGRHGGIFDAWYSVNLTNGTTSADGSGNPRKFIFVNGLVLPWNGSVPVTR